MLAGLLAASLSISAIAQEAPPAAPPDVEKTVTLYSSLPAAHTQIVIKAFEKAYGIKVNALQLTSGPLFSRFAGEAQSGIHQADVFITGSSAIYQKSPQLFHRLTKDEIPAVAKLPKVVAAENAYYLNVGVGPFRGAFNTGIVSKEDLAKHLKSWKDLTDPFWKGKLVTSDPRTTTLYMSWFRTMRQTYGDDWLKAVAANQPAVVDGGSVAVQQVAAGAYALGFPVALAHINPIQNKGAPIDGYIPEGPVIGIQSAMAVAKDAPHPKAAMLFATWMMTLPAQAIFCPTSVPTLPGEAKGCGQLSPNHVGTVDIIPEVEQKQIMNLLGIKS
jgi:iron(III) transport system substrate-binding protein